MRRGTPVTVLGIIGGIGPESTVDYYRLLLGGYRRRRSDGSAPTVVIVSIDMHRMLDLLATDLSRATDHLISELERLTRAGADVGLFASNTPHIVFDELQRRTALPLISIVEATRDEAAARGLNRLGLLGTRFTMQGGFYPSVFARAGIEVVVPEPDEQAYVHERYMGELVGGIVRTETRDRLVEIVTGLERRHGIQGLILGGTDLSPMFPEETIGGLQVLDTTRIHVDAALDRVVGMAGSDPASPS
jgi:aspartate racemase